MTEYIETKVTDASFRTVSVTNINMTNSKHVWNYYSKHVWNIIHAPNTCSFHGRKPSL